MPVLTHSLTRPRLSAELQQRLSQPLQIGPVRVDSRVLQSPLAGVTDAVFRRLVRRFAPHSLLYTEMIGAQGLAEAKKHLAIATMAEGDKPIGLQLYDRRPHIMANAARRAEAMGADVIDINMGCPVRKIACKGGGSALLREPELATDIVESVVAAVSLPVTVKTRIGWSESSIEIVDFARRLQDAGAQMLTLHGRTREQGFKGTARWEWIGRVKQALEIPVIANGDIHSVEAAIACLELTGADGVMCARGTLGSPELVGHIDRYLKTGEYPPELTAVERLQVAKDHVCWLWDDKGERGILQARKHMIWYIEQIPEAAEFRKALCRIESVDSAVEILDRAIELISLD
ncbi:MAG: tRNA dihydrouridine synthase DusB [Cyanobacteria bacterium P01_G01_bin.4]